MSTPTRSLFTRRVAPLVGVLALAGGSIGVALVTAAPTAAQVAPCVATATPNPVPVGVPYVVTVTGLGANDAITLDLTDPSGDTATLTGENADASGDFVLPQSAPIEGDEGTWTYQFTGSPSGASCTVDVVVVAALPTTTTTTAPSTTTTVASAVAVAPAFTG